MKRCPQCDFIYLDSDTVCDLDSSILVAVEGKPDEAAGERIVRRTEGWKWLTLVAVIGTVLGVVIFVVYHRLTRNEQKAEVNTLPAVGIANPSPGSSLSVLGAATPTQEPTPKPEIKPSPRVTPSSTRLSSSPVSTTTTQTASRGVTIRLTDGRTIEADEAWATKEGIWFRRDGVITLLKRNRVKGIDRTRQP
jgi:negative regulator of sigma E activity